MIPKLKQFIEENINLIENNRFFEVYNKINSYSFTRMFSEAMLGAGINPLLSLAEVPERFLYESTIRSVYIPEGVESIGRYAFADCKDLTNVELPVGLKIINEGAFMYCSNLESIILPSTLEVIDFGVFEGCNKLTNLYFRGTVDQWLKVREKDDSLRASSHKIICSDGTFDFE